MLRLEKVKLADNVVEESEETTAANKAKAEERLKQRLGTPSA
jgi:hypothetical protein